jgi:hypothetical protein
MIRIHAATDTAEMVYVLVSARCFAVKGKRRAMCSDRMTLDRNSSVSLPHFSTSPEPAASVGLRFDVTHELRDD